MPTSSLESLVSTFASTVPSANTQVQKIHLIKGKFESRCELQLTFPDTELCVLCVNGVEMLVGHWGGYSMVVIVTTGHRNHVCSLKYSVHSFDLVCNGSV